MTDRHNMTEELFASSDLHQKVLNACTASLLFTGHFRKEDIMAEVKDRFLIDSVRWDWIVRKLRADKSWPGGGIELIAVAESFFKADAATKQAMQADYPTDQDPTQYKHHPSFPGKYVAQGYGKRTAGWVMATWADGRFALYIATTAANNASGRRKRNEELGRNVTKQLISDGKTAKVLQIAKITGIAVPRIAKAAK